MHVLPYCLWFDREGNRIANSLIVDYWLVKKDIYSGMFSFRGWTRFSVGSFPFCSTSTISILANIYGKILSHVQFLCLCVVLPKLKKLSKFTTSAYFIFISA